MNLGERVACLEVELRAMKRLIYIAIAGMGLQTGTNMLPIIAASFG